MQCDFTDLRINQTVASPRSQVELHWIFANEVLRPEILVYVTTHRLPFVSCSSTPPHLSAFEKLNREQASEIELEKKTINHAHKTKWNTALFKHVSLWILKPSVY